MTLRSRPIAVVAGLAVVGILAIAARNAPKREPAPQQTGSNPTAALLVELIRANTSNPPGNTGSVANLLAPKFNVPAGPFPQLCVSGTIIEREAVLSEFARLLGF